MATLPAVPKVVRVDHHWTQGAASNIQIRNFFQYTGALSLADAATWVAAMNTAMGSLTTALMVNLCFYIQTTLTDLTSVSSPQVTNTTGATGGDPSVGNPGGLAFVIKNRFVRRYRGGHSRVYLPGIHPRHLLTPTAWKTADASSILSAYVTYINAALAGIPVAGGTATPVNISYFHGFTVSEGPTGRPRIVPTPRVTPLIDVITAFGNNTAPASQRRRNVTP